MEALLWICLPVLVAGGSALLAFYIMQARLDVAVAKEREAVSEARILLESHKKAMEESLKATEETAKRKALDDFLADIRSEERHYVRENKMLFMNRKRLVFQSTRPGYDCDQIFTMNADGSGQKLVSTGKGRTTCAYFLKDNKHIVYASTHEANPACPPSADRSKGYVWPVYPTYDIYLATDDGKIQKKLTDTTGYDAEATVNWKTGAIVYTS